MRRTRRTIAISLFTLLALGSVDLHAFEVPPIGVIGIIPMGGCQHAAINTKSGSSPEPFPVHDLNLDPR